MDPATNATYDGRDILKLMSFRLHDEQNQHERDDDGVRPDAFIHGRRFDNNIRTEQDDHTPENKDNFRRDWQASVAKDRESGFEGRRNYFDTGGRGRLRESHWHAQTTSDIAFRACNEKEINLYFDDKEAFF